CGSPPRGASSGAFASRPWVGPTRSPPPFVCAPVSRTPLTTFRGKRLVPGYPLLSQAGEIAGPANLRGALGGQLLPGGPAGGAGQQRLDLDHRVAVVREQPGGQVADRGV